MAFFTKYIVVVSEAQKKDISSRYKIAAPDKIKVISLGLELEDFLSIESRMGKFRRELNIDDDVILVGIIGRLVAVKNHKMFLEAARQVPGLLDEKFKVKYLVIGDGEEYPYLKARAKELGLENDVVFCGWREDMADIYSDLDIAGLTSLNEGTPVALIEALAAGRPVVATDVGGVADVVEDNINGYLVPSDDARAFARRLTELIKDNVKRSEFGLRGRQTVRERYSKERLVRDMAKLYKDAVLFRDNLSCKK